MSLELQPGNVKALLRRGLAYEAMEKYKLALADMTAALEIDPSTALASEAKCRLTRVVSQMA